MWTDDRLLTGYQSLSWVVPGISLAEGEADEALTATLVRCNAPRHARAVLYVHGWNDYFFQTHLADFWDEQGFDCYAIDLHRYGRNLRPGLFSGFATDLAEYFGELDEAYALIQQEGHADVTVMAHSTGGLIASLWVAQRAEPPNGLVLNSPWLNIQGSDAFTRAVRVVASLPLLKPATPLATGVDGFYIRSLSDQQDGEWSFDPSYKTVGGFRVRFGWAQAILAGQTEVSRGLDIATPVLSMSSARSLQPTKWDEAVKSADIVLNADALAEAAWRLGPNVTIVRIDGGMHDLVLSQRPVREVVFAEMARWLRAYVR